MKRRYKRENFSKKELLEIVRNDGWELSWIPYEQKDYDVCIAAVSNVQIRLANNESILCYVPKQLLTRELCLMAVGRNGNALRDVPEVLRDRELCLSAIINFGEALWDVPKELRDYEMCREAVLENGKAYRCIPTAIECEELAYLAVRTAPEVLESISENFKSLRVCTRAAISNTPLVARLLPDDIFDKVMYGR